MGLDEMGKSITVIISLSSTTSTNDRILFNFNVSSICDRVVDYCLE